MQHVAVDAGSAADVESYVEKRTAPRFTSLIRTAKLVCGQGEFVCVLRDVSSGGVRLKTFHHQPSDAAIGLELQNGETFELRKIREEGFEASYAFVNPVPVDSLIRENGSYPKRAVRIGLSIPVRLRSISDTIRADTINISQQGCRVEPESPLALAQSVMIDSDHLPKIRAKVRWRRDGMCGLVFEDTFTLRDFAVLVARLQCPALVTDIAPTN